VEVDGSVESRQRETVAGRGCLGLGGLSRAGDDPGRAT